MAYLLDANVFISAKNLHYGFDFCPAFWEWLIIANAEDKVFSIEKVEDELTTGHDELRDWAKKLPKGFFLSTDAESIPALSKIASWANNHATYSMAAKSDFLQIADYYLVAQALAGGHTVVTHEQPQNSKNRILIPNVCLDCGVKYINPFEMLRREQVRFILGRQA